MNEITYSPGRLAKKIGVSRDTLMNHLHDTGLIHQCFQMENGYWRIPYKVVIEIAGPEVLTTTQPPVPRRKKTSPRNGIRKQPVPDEQIKQPVATVRPGVPIREPSKNRRVDILTSNDDSPEHHTQMGEVLRWAGITMSDLIREYENRKEVKNE